MDYDDGFARSPNGLSLIHEIKIIYLFFKKIIKINNIYLFINYIFNIIKI